MKKGFGEIEDLGLRETAVRYTGPGPHLVRARRLVAPKLRGGKLFKSCLAAPEPHREILAKLAKILSQYDRCWLPP